MMTLVWDIPWCSLHAILPTFTDTYKDASGRGNVRRVLVIAAIPVFLSNGISIREARHGVCQGLQGAIMKGDFIRLAKQFHSRPAT